MELLTSAISSIPQFIWDGEWAWWTFWVLFWCWMIATDPVPLPE